MLGRIVSLSPAPASHSHRRESPSPVPRAPSAPPGGASPAPGRHSPIRRVRSLSRVRSRSEVGSPEAGQSITTVVRLRPKLGYERHKDGELGVAVRIEPPGRVTLLDQLQRQQARVFDCDVALDSSDPSSPDFADQAAVYGHVGAPLVERALQGFNCCLCAYGQTGTGKTHTLHGEWSSQEQRGLVPRVAAGLCERIAAMREAGAEVRLQVSFVEIYNNRLIDLLALANSGRSPATKPKQLQIHTHPAIGVYVDNLTEVVVHGLKDVGRLVAIGERSRHTAVTSMNQRSSRSHTVFSLKLEVRNSPDGTGARMANIQIVDLAGRENEQTSECTGERFRELTFINRSLFQLANCVNALSAGSREHVPFRNSKLTLLLSESFQRNSQTYLLATLSPGAGSFEENLLTCRFLESTGRIATQPVANRFCSEDLSAQLKHEIEAMRQQLGLDQSEAQLPTAPSQLQSRQQLLNYLSGRQWAQAVGQRRHSAEAMLSGAAARDLDSAKAAVVTDACGRVNTALDGASEGLDRLDAAQAAVGLSLNKAELRLCAMEAAVRDMMVGGSRSQSGPAADENVVADVIRLPPLIPVGGKLAQEANAAVKPSVSFTVELPPIVIL